MGLANAVLTANQKAAGAVSCVGMKPDGSIADTPAKVSAFQASVSGGCVQVGGHGYVAKTSTGQQLIGPAPDGTLTVGGYIASPLQIPNCELWLDGARGPVTAAWAAPADGAAVTTWIDSSGNARHATAATGTAYYSAAGGYGGKPGVKFGAGRFKTPAFVTSAYAGAITVFIVSAPDTVAHTSLKCKFGIDGAGVSWYVGNNGSTGARDITISGLTGFSQNIGVCPTLGGIDCIGVGSTEVFVSTDGFGKSTSGSETSNRTAISAAATAFLNSAVHIGGAGFNGYDWPGVISEVVVYSRYLTDTEKRQVMAYLQAKYEVLPLVNTIGNSLVSGTGTSGGPTQMISAAGTNLPSKLYGALAGLARVRSDAYPGRTLEQIIAETPAYSGIYANNYSPRVVHVVWELTNTLATTGSPWRAYELLRQKCISLQNKNSRIVVGTCLPRGDSGNDAKNAALTAQLNTLIRANWQSFADGLADFAADSRLSDFTNTTYFAADKVHTTDAGVVVELGILQPVITALLS